MKRILILSITTILLSSCSISAIKAEKTAEKFLTAYFEMDYESLVKYCAGDLAAELVGVIDDVDLPSEEMANLVKEASHLTTFSISHVDTKSERGVATVEYKIIPYGSEDEIERSMLLIKDKGEWLVIQLF